MRPGAALIQVGSGLLVHQNELLWQFIEIAQKGQQRIELCQGLSTSLPIEGWVVDSVGTRVAGIGLGRDEETSQNS